MIGIAGIVLTLLLLLLMLMCRAHSRVPLPICLYIVMSNHWHFVVQPQTDTQRTEFFRCLTHRHTIRWHAQWKRPLRLSVRRSTAARTHATLKGMAERKVTSHQSMSCVAPLLVASAI